MSSQGIMNSWNFLLQVLSPTGLFRLEVSSGALWSKVLPQTESPPRSETPGELRFFRRKWYKGFLYPPTTPFSLLFLNPETLCGSSELVGTRVFQRCPAMCLLFYFLATCFWWKQICCKDLFLTPYNFLHVRVDRLVKSVIQQRNC